MKGWRGEKRFCGLECVDDEHICFKVTLFFVLFLYFFFIRKPKATFPRVSSRRVVCDTSVTVHQVIMVSELKFCHNLKPVNH